MDQVITQDESCGRLLELHMVAGWLNQPVGRIDFRASTAPEGRHVVAGGEGTHEGCPYAGLARNTYPCQGAHGGVPDSAAGNERLE